MFSFTSITLVYDVLLLILSAIFLSCAFISLLFVVFLPHSWWLCTFFYSQFLCFILCVLKPVSFTFTMLVYMKWELHLFLFPAISQFPSDFKSFFFVICEDYFPLGLYIFFKEELYLILVFIFVIILTIYYMFHNFLNLKRYHFSQVWILYFDFFSISEIYWFPEAMHILTCLSLSSYLPMVCPNTELGVQNIFST